MTKHRLTFSQSEGFQRMRFDQKLTSVMVWHKLNHEEENEALEYCISPRCSWKRFLGKSFPFLAKSRRGRLLEPQTPISVVHYAQQHECYVFNEHSDIVFTRDYGQPSDLGVPDTLGSCLRTDGPEQRYPLLSESERQFVERPRVYTHSLVSRVTRKQNLADRLWTARHLRRWITKGKARGGPSPYDAPAPQPLMPPTSYVP